MPSLEQVLVGQVVGGRYRIVAQIASGAAATTFEAEDPRMNRRVAVKVYRLSAGINPSVVRRFRDESEAAAELNHPNILTVHDFGQLSVDDRVMPYVVTELVTGGSLRAILDRGRLLSPSQALVFGLDVCRGLDYAHRRGFTHGEVRPANLLFGDDRRVRIAEFGLARIVAERTWADPTSAPMSAARYASPEQARGEAFGPKSDVYSLCITMVEAVTGKVPFTSDSVVATLANRTDRLMPVSADLGPLASVLERAGRPSESDRYTAGELGRALVSVAGKMPRPEPIPIVGGDLFGDITGAVRRPAADPTTAVAVPESHAPSAAVATAVATADGPGKGNGSPPDPPVEAVAEPAPDQIEDGQENGRSRRALLIALVAVVVAAAIIGGAVAYRLIFKPSHEVPAVVGLPEGQALNELSGNGWDIVIERERSDDQLQGVVFRTDPPAAEMLKEGETVLVFVSEGPTLSQLPELANLTLDEAASELEALGLGLAVDREAFDEDVPAGSIISWQVPQQPSLGAGAEVVKGTVISVVVSTGPEPRVIPNLFGVPFDDAKTYLEDVLKLEVARSDDVFNNDVAAGLILESTPVAGETVPRGTTITVVVSKGPDYVVVPDLSGLKLGEARIRLAEVGLVLGAIDGEPAGVVVQQSVPPEGQAIRGTSVDIALF
jgi:serine/threonine-protein kinase